MTSGTAVRPPPRAMASALDAAVPQARDGRLDGVVDPDRTVHQRHPQQPRHGLVGPGEEQRGTGFGQGPRAVQQPPHPVRRDLPDL
ncbi:hypothetical protein [Streptomyces sp. NPDC056669]|uniref:hypothetical protein n=1 Tax=Streptomyces sp. NPDC056669 TaxID=3345903 RepID=UPI00367B58AB